MGILAINVNTTGLVGENIEPRRCTMITTDNYATITAPGYLNNQNLSGNNILPTDVFEVLFNFNEPTQSGSLGFFQVSFSSSTGFTLNSNSGVSLNPGYLYGLNLQYVSNTTFSINSGTCSDSTNTLNMVLPSSITINMATSGVLGLDTGSFQASKIYCGYVIGDSRGVKPISGIASLGQNGPTVMPLGYDKYRYVGPVFSDSSVHFHNFICLGRGVSKDYRIEGLSDFAILVSGTATTQTTIGTISNFLPNNNSIQKIKFASEFLPGTATDYARVTPGGFSIATSGAVIVIGAGLAEKFTVPFELEPGLPSVFEIDYLVDHTGVGDSTLTLVITGFILAL